MSNISNKMKNTFPQLGIILFFWMIGELVAFLLKSSVSGSIFGMILLTLALEFKIVKMKSVENVADFLVRNMAFFFIPPGVGLMAHLDIIADNWVAIGVATVLSTILVLIATSLIAQVGRKEDKK